MRRYFVCRDQKFFCLQCERNYYYYFLVCAMTFCLQCEDLLFSEWDYILCQELEFILFAVHLILRDEKLFVICG